MGKGDEKKPRIAVMAIKGCLQLAKRAKNTSYLFRLGKELYDAKFAIQSSLRYRFIVKSRFSSRSTKIFVK
jgi:hypothetical protein